MNSIKETEPRLWILMRSDMDSMNPGKMAAQATHAANAMVHKISRKGNKHLKAMLNKWENSTSQGFGTCIVLDAFNEDGIRYLVDQFETYSNASADITLDPTYPIRDGSVTHLLPIITCGWVFGDANDPFTVSEMKNLGLFK